MKEFDQSLDWTSWTLICFFLYTNTNNIQKLYKILDSGFTQWYARLWYL